MRPTAITGAVIAITGAARGIGLEIAKAFAAEGAQVAIGDLDAGAATAAAAQISNTAPAHAIGLALDVSDKASFEAFLDQVHERLGEVDILVNNAGIMWVGKFDEEPERSIQRTMQVNFGGVVHGVQVAAPRFRARGHGHIITLASAAARLAPAGEASYAASKHAVYGYLKAVHAELEGSGVELSVVMPTVVATDLAAGTTSGGTAMLTPADVARAVIRVAHRPIFESTVPRWVSPAATFVLALPEKLRFTLLRALVPNQVKTADAGARESYQRSALGGQE